METITDESKEIAALVVALRKRRIPLTSDRLAQLKRLMNINFPADQGKSLCCIRMQRTQQTGR